MLQYSTTALSPLVARSKVTATGEGRGQCYKERIKNVNPSSGTTWSTSSEPSQGKEAWVACERRSEVLFNIQHLVFSFLIENYILQLTIN